MSKRSKIFIGSGLIILVVVVLFSSISSENITYYYTPDEILQTPEKFKTRSIRVMGMVEEGSVKWDAATTTLHFQLTDTDDVFLNVVYQGAKPDMFKEGQGIIVEGTMSTPALFTATTLLVKHNEEYKIKDPHETKEDYLKTMSN